MNKNFLDKVIEQLVSETGILEDRGHIFVNYPFTIYGGININIKAPTKDFRKHCRDVYGLTETETDYVWDEYESIIKKYHRSNNFGGKLDL
tara:strand:- start:212 stop:484 length:273 start_codon:yes stop_codon:yes gene_type:complete